MTITTTLNEILAAGPCGQQPVSYFSKGSAPELVGWLKLLAGLEAKYGKAPDMFAVLPFADILEINGIADALWCCRTRPEYNYTWRGFDTWCITQQVEFLVPELRTVYTRLLAYVEGLSIFGMQWMHETTMDVRAVLRIKRNERAKRMGLTQAMEWSTTDASADEFSTMGLTTALYHATKREGVYRPGLAAYYAAEAAAHSTEARKAQAAKFLEIVK